jgi:glycine oxidase
MRRTTTGALRGAEREATRLRPLNLIRVMPAKEEQGSAVGPDVIVVGGGVIGTAIAWRAARAGRTVTIVDPRADDKASLVAAGMLGPVSEAVFGEQNLLNLNLHAVGRFPSFNAELEEAAGSETGLRTEGTLAVAYNNDDLAALDRLTEFRHSIGLKAERLDAKACRRLEPFLAPSIRGGVLATGDLSVDNRRYLAALRAAAAGAGVAAVVGSVRELTDGADGRILVRLSTGLTESTELTESTGLTELSARQVVIAAGWATGQIDGLPDHIRKAIRPVKGQILRLRHPGRLPHIIGHTIRAIVGGRDIYLVPRADGEIVVGATQEERDDRDVTAGAVHDLLRDAMIAVPAVSELTLAEASAGRRPGTSDNGPILGPIQLRHPAYAVDADTADTRTADTRSMDSRTTDTRTTESDDGAAGGVIIATGHFRNGVLLSAVTADAVAALLDGHQPHPVWAPFHPSRLQ